MEQSPVGFVAAYYAKPKLRFGRVEKTCGPEVLLTSECSDCRSEHSTPVLSFVAQRIPLDLLLAGWRLPIERSDTPVSSGSAHPKLVQKPSN